MQAVPGSVWRKHQRRLDCRHRPWPRRWISCASRCTPARRRQNFRIAAGTSVRLCLWESHHDGSVFENPMQFDPGRFISDAPSNSVFAPFGIDHHQCPFGAITVRFASLFVARLAAAYGVELLAGGSPVRGAYHYEPSRTLAVRLVPR